ncbi:MAG: hypothetical protein ND807_11955 [Vicinamibacterales bacterium]|nr:hypothetical protein [Vicinamibacterales bacterium]
MVIDGKPKSAVELAMERLRQRDADTGIVGRPPTESQKADIAEVRSLHGSKVAEVEILHRSTIMGLFDPAEREKADKEYQRELQRLNDDLERKIRKIRERSE